MGWKWVLSGCLAVSNSNSNKTTLYLIAHNLTEECLITVKYHRHLLLEGEIFCDISGTQKDQQFSLLVSGPTCTKILYWKDLILEKLSKMICKKHMDFSICRGRGGGLVGSFSMFSATHQNASKAWGVNQHMENSICFLQIIFESFLYRDVCIYWQMNAASLFWKPKSWFWTPI